MAAPVTYETSPTGTLLTLFFLLLLLVVLLIFLYKKLNKMTDGEYTIRNMIYREGGARDRVRGTTATLEAFLGVRLWPRGNTDKEEEGEEMRSFRDEEGDVEQGESVGGGEKEGEAGTGRKGDGGDPPDDEDSSLQSDNSGEARDDPMDDGEEAKAEETKEKEETVVEDCVQRGEDGGESPSEGERLLIDLKQLSGGAIWYGESETEENVVDLTVL